MTSAIIKTKQKIMAQVSCEVALAVAAAAWSAASCSRGVRLCSRVPLMASREIYKSASPQPLARERGAF
jgi:hypothetical protein